MQHLHLMIAKKDNGRALSIGVALLPVQRPVSPVVSPDCAQATCRRQEWFLLHNASFKVAQTVADVHTHSLKIGVGVTENKCEVAGEAAGRQAGLCD